MSQKDSKAKSQFAQAEEELIKRWQKERVFEKSLENRKGQKRFRFYDGPPFTSGPPHYGHIEQSAIKDAVVRYKTMRGYYVPRRTGCDTHGLPIENLVEKEHGFANKKDIVKFGIDKFNQACREVVFRHKKDFDVMYERLGRWDDPETTYATLDDDYIESVWSVFAQIYNKGLVYQGFKSMPYCPRCATPLSNFEVNDGYKDNVDDPSLFVKFKLVDEDTYFLAWTTTPWSLPGNAALAVEPNAKYVKVKLKDDEGNSEELILAEKRLEALNNDTYEVMERYNGKDLAGKHYEPLFKLNDLPNCEDLYKVWTAEFVSIEDGTGVLHVAPAFGEDDLNLGQKHGLPVLSTVDSNGMISETVNDSTIVGKFFKKADSLIIEELTKQGLVYAAETMQHTYPFCWRCETPLLYYAMPSWFVAVSKFRDKLVATGEETNWIPGHVKTGRFVKWLEGARDWAISRNRFWGAPIPVWVNEQDSEDRIVIGSLEELRKLSGTDDQIDMHRPGIDAIVINKDGKTYRRIEEVFDCWFESGSMPYAQEHYPFENKQEFEDSFPAEFVAEAIEQVHLWFYTLHVLATALFDKPAYKNVVASGLILGADGLKLSKRLRNYPPVEEVFDEYGADTLRFFVLNSPLTNGGDARLSNDGLRDVMRNVFMTLNNSYNFYKTYTDIDDWKPKQLGARPDKTTHPLDAWIIARLDEVTAEVTMQADKYQLSKATGPLVGLVDDLSNWYIRRSRRRFWKSENDADKHNAYETLNYALLTICKLLAPWAPFMSDEVYRGLTTGVDGAPSSVHLTDWPETGKLEKSILTEMKLVRQAVNDGLGVRAEAGIKVRQPLGKATIKSPQEISTELQGLIGEELNVKKVDVKKSDELTVELDTKITQELKNEGVARDIIRNIQQARKEAGLDVDNRIKLNLTTQSEQLKAAIKQCAQLIAAETLANALTTEQESDLEFTKTATIDSGEIKIRLSQDEKSQ